LTKGEKASISRLEEAMRILLEAIVESPDMDTDVIDAAREALSILQGS